VKRGGHQRSAIKRAAEVFDIPPECRNRIAARQVKRTNN